MADAVELAVERAIATMRRNLGDPITVDDMARAALFSKFHFSRLFQRLTGTTPGRFLSAIRLQEAKQLLVSTSMNIADVGQRVGYSSVGTFSTRFARSVGLSPTAYRRLGGYAPEIQQSAHGRPLASGTVHGELRHRLDRPPMIIFIGLFRNRIPEGRPVRCAVLPRPGPYRFDAVPAGQWYVLSQSIAVEPDASLHHGPAEDDGLAVGTFGPVSVRPGCGPYRADVELRPPRNLDPPVLLALLDARRAVLDILNDGGRPERRGLDPAA